MTAPSSSSDPSRRRFLWWVLAPAITLLVVISVAVAVASQSAGPLPSSVGTSPALGVTDKHEDSRLQMLPPTYAVVADDDDTPLTPPPPPPVDDDSPAEKPGPGMNATTVLSCLEDKCEPFTTQLGKTWREIANISLLRCLANSAFNKTAAAVCFKAAGPSELRDNLVACAGCNKCIKLNDQTSVDRACAKYKAWSDKKKAEAAATAPDGDTPATTTTTTTTATTALEEMPEAPSAETLAAGLPKTLREKYCSQFWCP